MAVVHIIIALVQIILRVIAEALTASLSLVAIVLAAAVILLGLLVASLSSAGTFALLRRRRSRPSNSGSKP